MGVFWEIMPPCRPPTGSKLRNVQVLLMCVNLQHFVTERDIGMYGERKMNARCPCTLPSTVETFGEEISAEACSGKEIAGLLRKIMIMMMMTRKL